MSEVMHQHNQNAEQLTASLIAEHGNEQVMLNGQAIPFKVYVAIGDALCPIPPEQRSPEANLRRLAGDLVKMDVQLDEKYASYVPEQPKETAAPQKAEAKQEKKAEPKKEAPVKIERAVAESRVAEVTEKAVLAPAAVNREKLEAPKPAVAIPKEIMAQSVLLETIAEKPVLPIQERVVHLEKEIAPPSLPEAIMFVEPEYVEIHMQFEAAEEVGELQTVEQEAVLVIPEQIQPIGEQTELTSFEVSSEPEFSVVTEMEPSISYESVIASEDMVFDVRAELTLVQDQPNEEPLEVLYETAPEADAPLGLTMVETAGETIVQAPTVVTEEFIAQVLPVESEVVAERLATMEPEVATELAAQIEMIVIVADRLHELVITGATEGEEAEQIEAFLKRNYEQVLLAIGIEPTQEILEKFIAYIYAEKYQLQVSTVQNYVEISDEGTHEKKLFDEQSVFTKAQQVSVGLSKKLGNSIGHILVTNLAA